MRGIKENVNIFFFGAVLCSKREGCLTEIGNTEASTSFMLFSFIPLKEDALVVEPIEIEMITSRWLEF
jgi:hypothetical protein